MSPVKGFRLAHPEVVELGPHGVAENRRFFLVGPDGQRLRSSKTPWPVLVRAEYDADAERLRMSFPDGTDVEGDVVALGDPVHSSAGTLDVTGRVVEGPLGSPALGAGGSSRPARAGRPGRRRPERAGDARLGRVARAPRGGGRARRGGRAAIPDALRADRLRAARGGHLGRPALLDRRGRRPGRRSRRPVRRDSSASTPPSRSPASSGWETRSSRSPERIPRQASAVAGRVRRPRRARRRSPPAVP